MSIILSPALSAEHLKPRDLVLGDILRRQARERRQAIAFETPARRWTFDELDETANRIAQGLLALGLGQGDRVAYLTRYGAESTLLIIAASRIGAVCAALNWRLAAPEIAYVLADSEARFLLTDGEFLPAVTAGDFPLLRQTVTADAAQDALPTLAQWSARFAAQDPLRDGSATDAALQLYSSGTTGLPKGVVMSNRNPPAATPNSSTRGQVKLPHLATRLGWTLFG